MESLYQDIMYVYINQYRELLESLKKTIILTEQKYLQRKITTEILDYLYSKIIQLIELRTYFLKTRRILNYLAYLKESKEKTRYLLMYDNINYLIKDVETLKNVINQKRHLYGRVYNYFKR